ncbi:MAG: ABC transporter permease [Oscillospiraceae bacterium]|nr:ABC transporter permease [Oscillospiraceae bacterium]
MGNLILHNLKKAKGQFISFGIVMLITAVILNTSLVLLFQTGAAYDSLFDELNTADLSVTVPSALAYDELPYDILNMKGVSNVRSNEALFASVAVQEFQDSEFTMNTYFYRLDDERELTKHTVSDKTDTSDEMKAYIPLYLSELGGYKPGESIRFIIDGKEYSFTVGGVVNEMQYGNYGTGFVGWYLSDEAYDTLAEDENFTSVTEYLIKADDGFATSTVKKNASSVLKDKNIPTITFLDRETTKGSRTMVSNTIVLLLAVFALLVLIVSIFLARFRIKNTIDEEINEMGVLKGIGYTSRMLMFSQVIPYLIVCGAGLISGVAASYVLIPVVAYVLAVQSGFSYTPVFDISAACISIITILAAVFLFTVLAAKKIKRLEPINAIRGIDPLKPAVKNHFPLDTSGGPIGFNLILKQSSVSMGRNVLLFAVTFVMMILLTFTGVLLYNVNIRPDNFLTTLSEELPDIRVQSDEEHFDELKNILDRENVRHVNYGISMTEYSDGSIPVIVCEDFSLLENNIVYEGRHPQAADEIAVGSEFSADYGVGDTFRLSLNGNDYEYKIIGYIQSINNNGLIAEITETGYENLSDVPLYSMNLYMEDSADIDSFVSKLDGEYDEYTVSVSNAAKETESMQMMYSSLITIVAAALFIITVLIVLLILYVIMNSMLTDLKTDFGIYKAMGFTSAQLIIQTVGSITPVVLLGALLSAVIGIAYLPAMFNGIFGVIGAMKNNFDIPLFMLLIMAMILTLVNIIIGVLLCRPIKKITAYSLIKE